MSFRNECMRSVGECFCLCVLLVFCELIAIRAVDCGLPLVQTVIFLNQCKVSFANLFTFGQMHFSQVGLN